MQDQDIEFHQQPGTGADLDDIYASKRKRILIVEEEPATILRLKHILCASGYDVLSARSGQEAMKKVSEANPNLVMLNPLMRLAEGWEICQNLRQISDALVMIISSEDSKEDLLRALRMRVADYLTKPLIDSDVVDRVEAILRPTNTPLQEVGRLLFSEIDLIIDYSKREVIHRDYHVKLTGREFELLSLLARNAPIIVTHHEIAMQLWGEADTTEARNRSKFLTYLLRSKFQRLPGQPHFIENVDRLGYRLRTTLAI